ncbi:MAG: carbonic anhydrase [Vicingaceae bacterium]
MTTQEIFDNNQAWINEKLNHDAKYFENLSKGQSPDFLYIGCSDSRVTAESMMGAEPGDVFVHRNIANVVSNLDVNSKGVINYAVEHLKVKHVVVCGHYFCGGVKAAMTSSDLGIINPWLQNIRDVYRLHQEELSNITDEDARYKRLVELNVQEQCINMLNNPDVQKAVKTRNLKVHAWVFDIASGKIIDLGIDLEKEQSKIADIYQVD